MSMSDPIADMFTRIRNALSAGKISASMPSSKLKVSVARLLQDEGYINGYQESEENNIKTLQIELKYYQGKPVIDLIKRISKPGLRVYKDKNDSLSSGTKRPVAWLRGSKTRILKSSYCVASSIMTRLVQLLPEPVVPDVYT